MTGSGWRRWALLAGLLAVAVLIVAQLFGGSDPPSEQRRAVGRASRPGRRARAARPGCRCVAGCPRRSPRRWRRCVPADPSCVPATTAGRSAGTARERLLPRSPAPTTAEYTTVATRENSPGRAGWSPANGSRIGAEPVIWFYTADHYDSFCELHPDRATGLVLGRGRQ
ncbi:MAG: hypothetical protein R2719_01755 [Micropruina sp.]